MPVPEVDRLRGQSVQSYVMRSGSWKSLGETMGGPPSWVIDKMLAKSCRPGYPVDDVPPNAVETWIAWIEAMGIQGLICLLSHDELTDYDHVSGGLLAAYRRHGL
jgi:hypothetical protein